MCVSDNGADPLWERRYVPSDVLRVIHLGISVYVYASVPIYILDFILYAISIKIY